MREGSVSTIIAFVVAAVIALMIVVVGNNAANSLDDFIRVKTIDIAGERVENVLYMTSSLEEARIQLNFQDEYGVIQKDSGEVHFNYSMDALDLPILDQSSSFQLNPPNNFNYQEGRSSSYCVVKTPGDDVSLEQGDCEWD